MGDSQDRLEHEEDLEVAEALDALASGRDQAEVSKEHAEGSGREQQDQQQLHEQQQQQQQLMQRLPQPGPTAGAGPVRHISPQAPAGVQSNGAVQRRDGSATPATGPRRELQKWVQCASCSQWRKVPYHLPDEEFGNDWRCTDNVWDPKHRSCQVPQALSNEEIDHILALQDDELAAAAAVAAAAAAAQQGHPQQQQQHHQVVAQQQQQQQARLAAQMRHGSYDAEEQEEGDAADHDEVEDEDDAMEGGEEEEDVPLSHRGDLRGGGGGIRGAIGPGMGLGIGAGAAGLQQDRFGVRRPSQGAPMYLEGPMRRARAGRGGRPGGRGRGRGVGGRGRGRGSMRGRGGYGRGVGVNEAAEALLGMGMGLEPEYGHGMGHMDVNTMSHPRQLLRPGAVVWAKVEGHDWWPARVVRRRTVPKEVGPPPGGAACVMEAIPVVFFTARGIPREVEERCDTPAGLVAASLRAMGLGEISADDEAEYAWLPMASIKPFQLGDVTGNEDGIVSGDPVLSASVAAAEAALRATGGGAGGRGLDQGSDSDGGWGISREVPVVIAAPRLPRGRGRGMRGGRGRGRGMRRGRGRGRRSAAMDDDDASDSDNSWWEGGSGSAAAAAAAGAAAGPAAASEPSKPVVESILGWRWALSAQEREVEAAKHRQLEAQRAKVWQAAKSVISSSPQAASAEAVAAALANACTAIAAEADAAAGGEAGGRQETPAAGPAAAAAADGPSPMEEGPALVGGGEDRKPSPSHAGAAPAPAAAEGETAPPAAVAAGAGDGVARSPGPDTAAAMEQQQQQPEQSPIKAEAMELDAARLGKEEADAVAALLDFGHEDPAAAAEAAAAAGGMNGGGGSGLLGGEAGLQAFEDLAEPEFLVKWVGKAHIHNEWVKEGVLLGLARRKLLNFKKRHGAAPCNLQEPQWTLPERCLARRPSPSNPGWEVLVKWQGQGYEAASWEPEHAACFLQPQGVTLQLQLWQRQRRAQQRATEAAAAAAAAARRSAAAQGVAELTSQPAYVAGAPLHPHQLAGLNWLRDRWAASQGAVIADEAGLGKTATVIAFLSSLVLEFAAAVPLLVVVPQSMLSFWEGELRFWAPPSINTVVYSGSVAARTCLHDHELWLQPSSMDGKVGAAGRQQHLEGRVAKADLVLTTAEVASNDLHLLRTLPWAAVVLDHRQRSRSTAAKAQGALLEMTSGFRLLLAPPSLPSHPEDLLQAAAFLQAVRPEDAAATLLPAQLGSDPAAQAAHLLQLLQPQLLRRLCREVSAAGDAGVTPSDGRVTPGLTGSLVEVQVPVALSAAQVEAYTSLLIRAYETLADPKPGRHAGSRNALLRLLVQDLQRLAVHTYLLPEFEPDLLTDGGADGSGGGSSRSSAAELAALVGGSGKVQLVDALLGLLAGQSQRVMIISHHDKALEVLHEYATLKYGAHAVELIDSTTPSAERYAAVQRFKAGGDSPVRFAAASTPGPAGEGKGTSPAPDAAAAAASQMAVTPVAADCPPFIFLQSSRCIGLGTDLPHVDVVLLLDSDVYPQSDVQVLRRAHCIGSPGQLVLLRLFSTQCVEEKVLQLAGGKRPLDVLLAPSAARTSSSGARLLEEIIRHGSSELLDAVAAAEAAGGSVVAAADQAEGAAAAGRPGVYSMQQLEKLLQAAAAAAVAPPPGTTSTDLPSPVGSAAGLRPLSAELEGVCVKEWPVADRGEASEAALEELEEEEEGAERGAEAAEGGEGLEEGGEGDAAAPLSRSDSAAATALYWDSLLRPRWEQLQREEAAAARERSGAARAEREQDLMEVDRDPEADLEGEGWDSEAGEEDAEGGGGGYGMGLRGMGAGGDLLHQYSSRASGNLTVALPGDAMLGDGSELGSARGARGRGRGGRGYGRGGYGRGRGGRRRRTDDDLGPILGGPMSGLGDRGHLEGGGLATVPSLGGSLDGDRPNKRRRRVGGGGMDDMEYRSQMRMHEQVLREYGRQERVKTLIADPSTQEHAIAQRAFGRIESIVGELGCDPELVPMACQAAEILLMMRQDDEVPSDFQDYTLVVVVAVAAHLMHQPLGQGAGLELLAQKYGHDLKSLDQVFWHVLTKLSYYRELTLRVEQLTSKGLVDPALVRSILGSLEGEEGGAEGGRGGLREARRGEMSGGLGAGTPRGPPGEVDSFSCKLDAILKADLTQAALAQGTLDNIPLGPLGTLMPLLQMAGLLGDAAIKQALKQVRESQEALVILDRTHTLKVQQIQKEYQDFMERIRAKAQGAIDQANRDYQSRKTFFTARINVMVEFLHQATPLQQLQTLHRSAAAEAAAAAAAAVGGPAADLLPSAAAGGGLGLQGLGGGAAAGGPGPQLDLLQPPSSNGPAAAGDLVAGGLDAALAALPPAALGQVLAAAAAGGGGGLGQLAMVLGDQRAADILQAVMTGRLSVDNIPDAYKATLAQLLQKAGSSFPGGGMGDGLAPTSAPLPPVGAPHRGGAMGNMGPMGGNLQQLLLPVGLQGVPPLGMGPLPPVSAAAAPGGGGGGPYPNGAPQGVVRGTAVKQQPGQMGGAGAKQMRPGGGPHPLNRQGSGGYPGNGGQHLGAHNGPAPPGSMMPPPPRGMPGQHLQQQQQQVQAGQLQLQSSGPLPRSSTSPMPEEAGGRGAGAGPRSSPVPGEMSGAPLPPRGHEQWQTPAADARARQQQLHLQSTPQQPQQQQHAGSDAAAGGADVHMTDAPPEGAGQPAAAMSGASPQLPQPQQQQPPASVSGPVGPNAPSSSSSSSAQVAAAPGTQVAAGGGGPAGPAVAAAAGQQPGLGHPVGQPSFPTEAPGLQQQAAAQLELQPQAHTAAQAAQAAGLAAQEAGGAAAAAAGAHHPAPRPPGNPAPAQPAASAVISGPVGGAVAGGSGRGNTPTPRPAPSAVESAGLAVLPVGPALAPPPQLQHVQLPSGGNPHAEAVRGVSLAPPAGSHLGEAGNPAARVNSLSSWLGQQGGQGAAAMAAAVAGTPPSPGAMGPPRRSPTPPQ